MTMLGLRSSIVSALSTNIASLRSCESHGGKFDLQELTRWAKRAPAVLVSVLAVPSADQQGGQARGTLRCAAFIITRGSSSTKRDVEALNLTETIVGHAVNNLWAYADAEAPQSVRADNLYSGEIDDYGVAMWVVSWTQTADLSIFDISTLDKFSTLDVQVNPALEYDGYDNSDLVRLQDTTFEAYGHIYLDTPEDLTWVGGIPPFPSEGPTKVPGTTTLKQTLNFDMPADNRLRYIGTQPVRVLAKAAVSADMFTNLPGNKETFHFSFAKNGGYDPGASVREEIVENFQENVIVTGVYTLVQNDYLELWADKTEDVVDTDVIMLKVMKMNFVVGAI